MSTPVTLALHVLMATASGVTCQAIPGFDLLVPGARWETTPVVRSVAAEVQAGADAWNGAGSPHRIALASDAAPVWPHWCNGISEVLWDDPFNEIASDPTRCSGVLAIGGVCAAGGEITEGDVVFAKGVRYCTDRDPLALAELTAHELGHAAVGLGHATDPQATMYYRAHFDGRGASLTVTDMNGIRALYGGDLLPVPTPTPRPLIVVTELHLDRNGRRVIVRATVPPLGRRERVRFTVTTPDGRVRYGRRRPRYGAVRWRFRYRGPGEYRVSIVAGEAVEHIEWRAP